MSRSLLDQALKIYGDREYYDPEKARALYKKGKSLQHVVMEGNKSNKSLNEALGLHRKLKKEKADFRRGVDELTDADFDDLIVFWSK
jgi:ATP:corrinoid adenosyltransferase